jgi:hypothetical protein
MRISEKSNWSEIYAEPASANADGSMDVIATSCNVGSAPKLDISTDISGIERWRTYFLPPQSREA